MNNTNILLVIIAARQSEVDLCQKNMESKQISLQIRNRIVKDRQEGLCNREIGRKYCVSEAAVRKI